MAVKYFTQSMSSANSIATFDLAQGWQNINLVVPTFTSQTRLNIEISTSGTIGNTGVFFQLFQQLPQTTTVAAWPFQIPATATCGGCVIPLPFMGARYLRVRAIDSAPTAAVAFTLICNNNY